MGGILTPEDYREIYRLTGDTSPLDGDCGLLCGQACCRPEAPQGIYLLPGEEAMLAGEQDWLVREMHDPQEYYFPDSWEEPVHFVRCQGICPRELRPLQCRTYPAAPHIFPDGRFVLIRETLKTTYRCPILAERLHLRQDWLEALYLAWRRLLNDPLIYDLVLLDSSDRDPREIITAYGG